MFSFEFCLTSTREVLWSATWLMLIEDYSKEFTSWFYPSELNCKDWALGLAMSTSILNWFLSWNGFLGWPSKLWSPDPVFETNYLLFTELLMIKKFNLKGPELWRELMGTPFSRMVILSVKLSASELIPTSLVSLVTSCVLRFGSNCVIYWDEAATFYYWKLSLSCIF